jgi:hypothetical protein
MRQVGKRFIFVKLDCCRYGSPVATGSTALIIPFHLQDPQSQCLSHPLSAKLSPPSSLRQIKNSHTLLIALQRDGNAEVAELIFPL